LNRVQRQKQRLLESNRQLEASRQLLEEQVAERAQTAETARREAELANAAISAQIWQIAGQARLNETLRGQQDIPNLATSTIRHLCVHLDAQVGALFVMEDGFLQLAGSYAFTHRQHRFNRFRPGEGLVGQAALEKQLITLSPVPEDYLVVSSGLRQSPIRQLLVTPFLFEREVVGVVELGTQQPFTQPQIEFLQTAMENIAIAFHTAQARQRIDELLTETQEQAEVLQTRSVTLRQNQAMLDRQNRELLTAQQELEKRANELARASHYKSGSRWTPLQLTGKRVVRR
jgi:GAF domain-containing protein